ncbi:MAG: hypothetical protein ABFD89_23435, partial [Bryobacteraceae bacterium]
TPHTKCNRHAVKFADCRTTGVAVSSHRPICQYLGVDRRDGQMSPVRSLDVGAPDDRLITWREGRVCEYVDGPY